MYAATISICRPRIVSLLAVLEELASLVTPLIKFRISPDHASLCCNLRGAYKESLDRVRHCNYLRAQLPDFRSYHDREVRKSSTARGILCLAYTPPSMAFLEIYNDIRLSGIGGVPPFIRTRGKAV